MTGMREKRMDDMGLINNPDFICYYESPVGLFFIRYNSSLDKWDLGLEDDIFGYYLTTIAAADDVYCQSTGCNEWGMLDIFKILDKVPTDIYGWERRPKKGKK
jgi:hypothetical protein